MSKENYEYTVDEMAKLVQALHKNGVYSCAGNGCSSRSRNPIGWLFLPHDAGNVMICEKCAKECT